MGTEEPVLLDYSETSEQGLTSGDYALFVFTFYVEQFPLRSYTHNITEKYAVLAKLYG